MTYLINLPGSDERLRLASENLQAAGIGFERIAAFDGRGRNPGEFSEYRPSRARAFYGREMTGGELGCYFSHLECARAFLATGARFALVLEDDAVPASGAGDAFAALLEWAETAPADWDLVNLGKAPRRFFSKTADLPAGVALVRAHYFPVTTTAILWSREGAERFVATGDTIYAPLDHFFRRWLSVSGRGLATIPPIFSPSGAESELDDEGGAGPARRRVPKSLRYFVQEFRRQSVNYLAASWHLLRYRMSGS